MSPALLLAAVLALPAGVDDALPAALDALIEAPEDPFFFGLPDLADGVPVFTLGEVGSARSLSDLGDVTGDGAPDLAVGYAPGGPGHALVAHDGRSGAVLWAATPDGGGFRTLSGLDARDGRLAYAVTSLHARVGSLDASDGTPSWERDLFPAGGGAPLNALFARFVDDLGGDAQPDLLVGAGAGLDALWLLDGADGSTLWTAAPGGPVYAACLAPDLDGDTIPDVWAAGGAGAGVATALSGADGGTIWSVPLTGPGTVLLPLQDLSGDGVPDVVAGMLAEPFDCLVALSGSDGATIWTALGINRNVTSLARLGDIWGDGLDDFAVGSFDHAVPAVNAADGQLIWRQEVSTNNTGATLSVAAAGDLDGNGAVDVYTASMDHLAYLIDGEKGFFLATHDTRRRGVVVAAIGDGDGDGRDEWAVGGQGALHLLSGASGIAAGPIVFFKASGSPLGEITVQAYAYPTKTLALMGSLGTGNVLLPGYGPVPFGLDPDAFAFIHFGTAPAAGESGYQVGPFPREFFGLTMYFQAATIFEPGHGLLSKVAPYDPQP